MLPVLLGLQFLLILGPAYLVGACNVRFRDTARITQVLLQLLLFLTPVFYATSSIPERWRFVYRLNPMATLVDAYRDVLLFGRAPDLDGLAIVFALSCAAVVGRLPHVRAHEEQVRRGDRMTSGAVA